MAIDAEGNESGWTDAWKVTVDNDATTTPPEEGPANKDECKNGGWMQFEDPTFRNQGQCISYVNRANR